MKTIFKNSIETENYGMAGGKTYYDVEELYQAFKERLIEDLAVESDELIRLTRLYDLEDEE